MDDRAASTLEYVLEFRKVSELKHDSKFFSRRFVNVLHVNFASALCFHNHWFCDHYIQNKIDHM